MPTNLSLEGSPQTQRLHDMESSMEALNARIARLAIGLGVSLNSDHEVIRALSFHQVSLESHERRTPADRRELVREHADADRRELAHVGVSADLRIARKLEELRGLLVLRYGVETRYVDEVGVVATRQILVEAEAHLVREGFKPGADGIDLNRLFKES